ncbi:MAG TPA: HEPN domain-containing protein [Gaiellaceae bacterium]|jgi:uncharacterized protein (UPF0332 family)
MASARDRLGAARAALDAGFSSNAASAAYYAMLYAARAALSEQQLNAKTHAGTWALFREAFVAAGRFDDVLFSDAHGVQQLREAADYDALIVPDEDAERIVELAGRFVAAVAAEIS